MSSASAPTSRILIVDDEACLRLLLGQSLKAAGFEVMEATGGMQALEMIATEGPMLVVMDVSMPGLDGFAAVERMRVSGMTQPVIMLTSFDDVDHRVRGLGVGADDYLTKPFHHRELVARVQALLRRATATAAKPTARRIIQLGDVTVDLGAKQAHRAGVPVALTRTEFALLECLASERGRPVSRERLLATVWGYEADTSTRTVETHIWRLRKKLGDIGTESPWLQTLTGLGYVMAPEAPEPALISA
ncbi:MAG: response regulator transcription factor [Verrucomicrobia bacterium]|nr:response regulator transcription factor [Verrucomicrobiota bacterium]